MNQLYEFLGGIILVLFACVGLCAIYFSAIFLFEKIPALLFIAVVAAIIYGITR